METFLRTVEREIESSSLSSDFLCRFLGETRAKKECRFGFAVDGSVVDGAEGLLECRFGSESRGSKLIFFGRSCRLGEELRATSVFCATRSSGRGEVGGVALDSKEVLGAVQLEFGSSRTSLHSEEGSEVGSDGPGAANESGTA